jgi:hypothetical protein
MKTFHVWVFLNGQMVRMSQMSDGYASEKEAIKAAHDLGHSHIIILPVLNVEMAAVENNSLNVQRAIKAKSQKPKTDGQTT